MAKAAARSWKGAAAARGGGGVHVPGGVLGLALVRDPVAVQVDAGAARDVAGVRDAVPVAVRLARVGDAVAIAVVGALEEVAEVAAPVAVAVGGEVRALDRHDPQGRATHRSHGARAGHDEERELEGGGRGGQGRDAHAGVQDAAGGDRPEHELLRGHGPCAGGCAGSSRDVEEEGGCGDQVEPRHRAGRPAHLDGVEALGSNEDRCPVILRGAGQGPDESGAREGQTAGARRTREGATACAPRGGRVHED